MIKKINKNNELIKNNSAKLLNLIHNKNYGNKKRYKNLIINTKKGLVKPKTYNYFSPGNIKPEEDDNINNFYGNKKISFYSMSQKKLNKNYGFKNKKEQEMEIFKGAFEYLKNEFNNKNIKNIKGNHIINSSGISIQALKYKFKMNENLINSNKNKDKYKVPYDYKKKGKQFGEDSAISLNSTSSGLFLLNNNFSIYEDEASTVRDNFQDELHRIINFNKKMKSNGKDYNINNIISNIKFKKSVSQSNFFDKKNLKILEIDKIIYSKGKPLSKTNKNFTPVSNIFKKSLNKTTNTGITTSKNINLNGNQINSFNNINYSKFNIKSNKNQNQKIIDSNMILNKENNKENYADYYQDEPKDPQKIKNKISKKANIIENNDNQENQDTSFKFRFVLDKYLKKQKPKNQQKLLNDKNNKEKENIQNKNIIKAPYENYAINGNKEFKKNDNKNIKDEENNKKDNNKIKNKSGRNKEKNYNKKYYDNNNKINNNILNYNENNKIDFYQKKNKKEKPCDSFFDEGINNDNLYDLKEDNKKYLDLKNDNILDIKIDKENINKNYNDINHINIFEDGKLNISNINQNQDSNLYSKNSNDIINEKNLGKNIEYNNDKNNNNNINDKNNNIYYNNNNENNNNNISNNIENNNNISNNITYNSNNINYNNNKNNINMHNDIYKLNNLEKKNENNINKINGLNNQNIKNLKNDKIENVSEKSFDNSCNGLGEDTNIIDKINLPSCFSPLIKNINNMQMVDSKNISKNNINNSKNTSKDLTNYYLNDSNQENISKVKNNKTLENILKQTNSKPQKK